MTEHELTDDRVPGVVRHEDELRVSTQAQEIGSVRARKHVETDRVEEIVPRQLEEADVERIAVSDGDSGEVETLPDGSVSIPLLEEELIITKRTVVRERIVIRKRTVTQHERIEAELRKERVEVEGDPGLVEEVPPRER